jgi:hypothetical protein
VTLRKTQSSHQHRAYSYTSCIISLYYIYICSSQRSLYDWRFICVFLVSFFFPSRPRIVTHTLWKCPPSSWPKTPSKLHHRGCSSQLAVTLLSLLLYGYLRHLWGWGDLTGCRGGKRIYIRILLRPLNKQREARE